MSLQAGRRVGAEAAKHGAGSH
jgi:hypothetical protein